MADVGVIGMPNAGKSTMLSRVTAARPKIANYPFTTIVPNLGVVDLPEGKGLVLCDIPGLISGASEGVGMGHQFLRHVQRNKILLHIVDGSADDPVANFRAINEELRKFDSALAERPQVVVLNKMDLPEVASKVRSEATQRLPSHRLVSLVASSLTPFCNSLRSSQSDAIVAALKAEAGHTRVMPASALQKQNLTELMFRLKKFSDSRPVVVLPEAKASVDLGKIDVEAEPDDFRVETDPSFPGQWRIVGEYIEGVAKMTHWEYPEAVERFGRIVDATGISSRLEEMGAEEGDAIMIGTYDFDFSPGKTNPYIPPELLEQDEAILARERRREDLRWGRGETADDDDDDDDEVDQMSVMMYNLSDDDEGEDEDYEDDDEELEIFTATSWSELEEGDEIFTS